MKMIDENFSKIRKLDNETQSQLKRESSRKSLQEFSQRNSNLELEKVQ